MLKTQKRALPGRSILSVHLGQETDFLLARQRAKQIAKLVGFDLQDQTRVATAVSEIARNAYEYGKGGKVEYFLDAADEAMPDHRSPGFVLRIVVSDGGQGIPHIDDIWSGTYQSKTGMGIGMIGARRLMDRLDVETSDEGTRVTLVKHLPRAITTPPSVAEIAAVLLQETAKGSHTRTTALHDQNQELLTLLGELRSRETELRTLNAELEETNRGVLVLYAELEDKAQAVQQASEMKTRFLSGVTHELRTPLNSIVSLSRLMLSHTDGPLNAEQEKQAQFILRSAQNLTEMVNDLLDLAKIEAGKSVTNLSNFTVAELYAGLRGMFRPLATNPNVKLIFEIPDMPLPLWSDEGKLAQVLRNFISNALKFTEKGTITITATPLEGQLIRFSVADTGVGIDPANHELVMQEWGQVSSVQHISPKAKGSGLGLPLSRSLAELLGGFVDFTSTPGQGSTFNVTLPALVVDQIPTADEEAPYILMVDDDEVARYLLRRTLSSMTTATVEEAKSGAAGMEVISRHHPRLIFLDLVMPGMGGAEFAKQLRANPETASLPIVLYTSKILSDEERQNLEALDLTIVSKRGDSSGGHEEQRVQIERALLGVGLSNIHQERPS